jgi:hypothetical protein
MSITKKKYTDEEIEHLVKTQVIYWRYDNYEDVYMNCWTVSGHKQWGIYPRPEFPTKEYGQNWFREYLKKHYGRN